MGHIYHQYISIHAQQQRRPILRSSRLSHGPRQRRSSHLDQCPHEIINALDAFTDPTSGTASAQGSVSGSSTAGQS